MLGRAYAALYGDDLAGLMLCGLVSQFKGCEIEYNDPAIRAAVAADPYQPSGEWFGKVFLGMTDRIENPNGPADWIAVNPDIVADHAGDPFNTFDTTLELSLIHILYAITRLRYNKPACYGKVFL